LLSLLALLTILDVQGQRRTLPISAPAPRLGESWLWLDSATQHLRAYIPGNSPTVRVLYHELSPKHTAKDDAWVIRLRARAGQCVLINNRLILSAFSSGEYLLDLSAYSQTPRVVLAIWHPTEAPDPNVFQLLNVNRRDQKAAPKAHLPRIRPAPEATRNILIFILILIGLLYGTLRAAFGISLSRFLRLELATRQGGELRLSIGMLPSTALTIFFGFGFAISFALLIVVVQTSFVRIVSLQYLFPLSDRDVLVRVGIYTGTVGAFMVLRYVYLAVAGYVFDLTALVNIQYAAFVRTLLLAGAYVPLAVLLHLVLAAQSSSTALRLSNLLLSVLLFAVVIRSILALRTRYSLTNPHLFAYLCATEILPLLVLFRLIVSPTLLK
jgi:hypothetical protein